MKEVKEVHENFNFVYGYTDSYGKPVSAVYTNKDECWLHVLFPIVSTQNKTAVVTPCS